MQWPGKLWANIVKGCSMTQEDATGLSDENAMTFFWDKDAT